MALVMLVPRQGARREHPGRALAALVLALLGHGVMLGVFLFLSNIQLAVPPRAQRAKKAPTRPVVLRGLTAEQWAKNRGDVAPRVRDERKVIARAPEKEKDKKKPPEEAPGQVVAVAPGNGEVDPNARFAAETSNKVQKETRAKEQTAFYRNAQSRRTSPSPQPDAKGKDDVDVAQQAGNDGQGDDDKPLRSAAPAVAVEIPDIKRRSEVAMRLPDTPGPGAQIANRTETDEVQGNSKRLRLSLGQPGGDEAGQGRVGAAGVLSLLPSPAVLDKVSGAAANDHLNDVELGDGTYLNTREWKYASFFNRVKQSVGQQWHPQSSLRLRDPTLQIYGGRDRYTVVQVTLSQEGRLKDVYVEKSCGVDFLDLEAIKAFERASPFPNPPPGLLAADATVRFQFGFFLEMSGRPGLRLFRSTD